MDDDDLKLSLNLNLSYSGSRSEQRNKPKVFGNRAQRIKQRKQIRYEKQKAESVTANQANYPAPTRKRPAGAAVDGADIDPTPPKKSARKEVEQALGGRAHQGYRKVEKGVISSLFRHNPDIPAVKSHTVKGVKEEVFSSTRFSDLPLHPHLVSNLEEKLQLTTMTRAQQLSIPVILRQKDVLIKSQTGSGKTLAYAVPIVHSLATLPCKIQRTLGPFALVIVPTRELAIQSYETFSKLLQSAVWIVAGCLMGGEKRKAEKARIRKGINILVSTPGRLLDHLKHTDCLRMQHLRFLVIDEADRLLELGYERDVAQIITTLNDKCSNPRQTILVSATLSAGVERLSGMTLKDHESIDASADPANLSDSKLTSQLCDDITDAPFVLPEKLKQYFVVVPCKLRLVTLAAFILWKCKLQDRRSKMVVFLSTQDSVEFHHRLFSLVLNPPPPTTDGSNDSNEDGQVKGWELEDSVDLFRLHGDMAQKDRTQVFQEFTEATSGVLLCTDVASRGLHLPSVDWIVQYSTPGATVDYIHRVGRTARAGKQGNALLFLLPSETAYVQELNKHQISLRELAMQDILTTLQSAVLDLPSTQRKLSKRPLPRTYEEASTFLQDRFEESVLRNPQLKSLAVKGYQSFVRAYATYPSHLKQVFSLRHLHLGHVTKSFALREAPSHLQVKAVRQGRGGKGHGMKGGSLRLQFEPEKKSFSKPRKKLPLSVTISEFGSGLESGKGVKTISSKPKKHKKKPGFR